MGAGYMATGDFTGSGRPGGGFLKKNPGGGDKIILLLKKKRGKIHAKNLRPASKYFTMCRRFVQINLGKKLLCYLPAEL